MQFVVLNQNCNISCMIKLNIEIYCENNMIIIMIHEYSSSFFR